MKASLGLVGKEKGLGILTLWELRHVWNRLQESQQTHPEIHTHMDRLAHTQDECPPQTGTFSHSSSSWHPQLGWAHCESLNLSYSLGVYLKYPKALGH